MNPIHNTESTAPDSIIIKMAITNLEGTVLEMTFDYRDDIHLQRAGRLAKEVAERNEKTA